MAISRALALCLLATACAHGPVRPGQGTPERLSAARLAELREHLAVACQRGGGLWLDTSPQNGAELAVVIEIPEGGREKREYDVHTGKLELDRVLPEAAGGYPAAYGFVPQTFYHDGDPIDALVIGGDFAAGELAAARLVAILYTTDQHGLDAKLVAVVGAGTLTAAARQRISGFFATYKALDDDPKTESTVLGWGGAEEARAELDKALRFFADERSTACE